MREEIGRTSPMATELVKGAASAVRSTVEVRGDRDGVSTRHHTIFKVGDTTVMFASVSPPAISDGDQIVVAGRRRGKMLVAEAYVNRTLMVRGDSGMWQNLIGAAIGLPVGAAGIGLALLGHVVPSLPRWDLPLLLMILAAGLVMFGSGLLLLYRWVLIRRAVKLLKGG
jgi:hypothetical protein